MKHTIKLLTLAFMLATILTLTGCPGPVNNYIEPPVVPEYTITVNVTNGTAEYPATAKAGDNVTITATAEEGFTFDGASSAFNIPDCSLSSDRKVITWNFSMFAEDVVINVTFKHEHIWEEITTDETKAATCTEDGLAVYKCKTCGAIEKRTVSKLGHDYQGGYCERCREYEFENNRYTIRVFVSKEEWEKIHPSKNTLRTTTNNSEPAFDLCMFSFEKENDVPTNLNDLIHLKSIYNGYSVHKYYNGGVVTYTKEIEEGKVTVIDNMDILLKTNE